MSKVDEIYEELLKLPIPEFYELMEKLQEFMMEQKSNMERYVKK